MSRHEVRSWVPVCLLGLGCALLLLAKQQESIPLVAPLNTVIPGTLLGLPSRDQEVSPEEQQVAGMSDYLLRFYGSDSVRYEFSLYIGYYEDQTQGSSIHSPRNCLPGAGWEPLQNETRTVAAGGERYAVNRYLLGNRSARVVVYYWYQGRGRVVADEYAVKWNLLRDKALFGRSDEALVRIVVPLPPGTDEGQADAMAEAVIGTLIPLVSGALPDGPQGASRPVQTAALPRQTS